MSEKFVPGEPILGGSKLNVTGTTIVFPFKGCGKNLRVFFLQHIFGRDFLSPRTTIFSGIENYPSASISCCSDDLAQLLQCLDL